MRSLRARRASRACTVSMTAAVLCLTIGACRKENPAPAAAAKPTATPPLSRVEEIGWMRLDPGPAPPESLLEVPRTELPALYRSRYRIKPDRRYLYAFAEVDRIASGRSKPATLFLSFADDRWTLRLESEEIGTLPEIPTASEAERLLEAWTESRLKKHAPKIVAGTHPDLPALELALTETSAEQVFVAFQKLGALSAGSELDPGLLRAATRGVVWLAAQTNDTLQLSDPLYGHALALLATARALEPGSLASERALLLRLMGYEAEAVAAAARLPASDPASAFAAYDNARLESMASAARVSARVQYLYLLDLMRLRDPERWWPAFRKTSWVASLDLASLSAVVRLGDFKVRDYASRDLTVRAFLEVVEPKTGAPSAEAWGAEELPSRALGADLAKSAEVLKSPPEVQTRQFEKALSENATKADGRLLDAETVRSFYRATFYSSIYETARFLFDQLSDNDGAARFAQSFRDPAPGTAAELALFLQDRAAFRNGASRDKFFADFGRLRSIGVAPLWRMLVPIANDAGRGGTDPTGRQLLRLFVAAVDTRPANLEAMAGLTYDPLQDPRLREKYLRASGAAAPASGYSGVTYAILSGDVKTLRAVVSDPKHTMYNRRRALEELRKRKAIDAGEARRVYQGWMRQEPDDLGLLSTCAWDLAYANQHRQARDEIRAWIARRPTRDRDLTWASAVVLEADILSHQKKWTEAYAVIEPALGTGMETGFVEGAWFLEEAGDFDGAMKLARAAQDRYPNGQPSYTIMARLHWRQRAYEDAAKTLAGCKYFTRASWEGDVAKSFAHVFAKGDSRAAVVAFDALKKRGIPGVYLLAVAKMVGTYGDRALAASLLGSLASLPGGDGPAAAIWAYDEIVATEGKDAAAAWLAQHVPSPHQFALIAFQFARYDALWATLEASTRAAKADELQLMRAATVLIDPDKYGDRRAELVAHFESRPRKGWAVLGLYLLGKATEEEVFATATNLPALATLGWLKGVRAASEGRYEEASDWFSIGVDTDQDKAPPHAWSYMSLQRWITAGKPFSVLAAENTPSP